MKHIYKYNDSFFTEESKNGNLHNIKFWNLLSDFELKYPEADLTVIYDVKWDRHIGKYVEYLDFQCNQVGEYKQVRKIYENHYYLTPLTFLPSLDQAATDEEIHDVESRNK